MFSSCLKFPFDVELVEVEFNSEGTWPEDEFAVFAEIDDVELITVVDGRIIPVQEEDEVFDTMQNIFQ